MASDTYSVTLSVPDLGVRRARALCNHFKRTVNAESVQHHREKGVLEIAWANPSEADSNLNKLGDLGLTDATSQRGRLGSTSGDGQSQRSEGLYHSPPDGKTIRYGKKGVALRVHNDETGGERCHTLRQDLRGKWSAISGAIGFPQKDGTMRVENGNNTTTFVPGKVRTVVGRHGKWRTTSTVSPATYPFARSLNNSLAPSQTGRSDMPPSDFVVTLDVPKEFPHAQEALVKLGGAIGAKSIEYNTAAHSVKITLDEPVASGDLKDFLRASLAKSKHNPDGQSDSGNQMELSLEAPNWFAGDVFSLYVAPTNGMSYTDPSNKGRKTHTFIRDLEGNLSVASGANGRQNEEGGMTVWDGDLAMGIIAGPYSQEQGEGGAWTIETMQAPEPNSEVHSPELFKMLQGAKPRTDISTRDATVVTII
jgi:hypothetical protein